MASQATYSDMVSCECSDYGGHKMPVQSGLHDAGHSSWSQPAMITPVKVRALGDAIASTRLAANPTFLQLISVALRRLEFGYFFVLCASIRQPGRARGSRRGTGHMDSGFARDCCRGSDWRERRDREARKDEGRFGNGCRRRGNCTAGLNREDASRRMVVSEMHPASD